MIEQAAQCIRECWIRRFFRFRRLAKASAHTKGRVSFDSVQAHFKLSNP
jgi:hypothetical protein